MNLQFGFLTGPAVLACMTRLSITLLTALIALLASLCLKKSLSSEIICLFLSVAKGSIFSLFGDTNIVIINGLLKR